MSDERLEQDLRAERARSAILEGEVRALRRSASFRFGHAVALAVREGARLRPTRAGLRGLVRALRKGGAAPPPAPEPSVLVVAWGGDDERLRRGVERIERLQAIAGGFEAVFVVDGDGAPARAAGHRVERLTPLAEWTAARPADTWGAYVASRMAELAAEHEPRAVVVLEGEAPGALEQGVLDALIVPSLGAGDDNALPQGEGSPTAALAALLEAELSGPPPRRPR